MKVVELKPITITPAVFDAIEKEIVKAIRREIYDEIIKLLELKKSVIKNDATPKDLQRLGQALRDGTLTYSDGVFSGQLDSDLSLSLRNAGAQWDRHLEAFRLSWDDLGAPLQHLVRSTQHEYEKKMRTVERFLAGIEAEEVSGRVAMRHIFDNAIKKTEKQFKDNVAAVTLTPQLTEEQRTDIVNRWQTQARESITGLVKDQVDGLRAKVAQSVEKGNRYGHLIAGIQHEFGVSQGRAKLIARQETKTLVTSYAASRYADAGVTEYRWKAVAGTPKHPTRVRHKALSDASDKGTTYRFDDPPVTTEPGEPERRNNPGEDFNCRCRAIPIVKFGER